MSNEPAEQLLDGAAVAEHLASKTEAHLDAFPLPVEDEVVASVVARIGRRIHSEPEQLEPRRRARWPWLAGGLLLAASGLFWLAQPIPPGEELPTSPVFVPAPPMLMSTQPVSQPLVFELLEADDTHELAGSERSLTLSDDARVRLAQEGHTAVLRVERGTVESDGTVVTSGQWALLSRFDGVPHNVVFRDGQPPPVLPAVWEGTSVDAQLRSLRWQVIAELGWFDSRAALADEAKKAEIILEGCAKGCPPDLGGEVVLAQLLYLYVVTGRADAELGATLRGLDFDRYEKLPSVLQSSARSGLPWAQADTAWQDRKLMIEAYDKVLPSTPPSDSRKNRPLTIRVTDPAGAIVPAAVVQFPLERARHRVNSLTGQFTESVLYLRDGREIQFAKGMKVDLFVTAPGFERTSAQAVLEKRRKNQIEVVLQPMAYTTPPGASALEAKVMEAFRTWKAEEDAIIGNYTEPRGAKRDAVRKKAAKLAAEWMAAGGGERALELCLAAGAMAQCGR